MSSLASTSRNISKRSLTFNKSFVISFTIHILIIFGVSMTTFYKIPLFKEAPIINVKLASCGWSDGNGTIGTDMFGSLLETTFKF